MSLLCGKVEHLTIRNLVTILRAYSPGMEQSYLFQLIKTLTEAEKREVLAFADLDFVNNGKLRVYVKPILEIGFEIAKRKGEEIGKKMLYDLIFKNQEYKDGKLEKVMVEAHKIIRNYLLCKEVISNENDFEIGIKYSEVLRLRKLDERYRQANNKLKRLLLETKQKSTKYYEYSYMLEDAIHDEVSLHNQAKGDLNIPDVLTAFDVFSYIKKLEWINRYLIQRKITTFQESEIISRLVGELDVPNRYILVSPTLEINWELFKLFKKEVPNPQDFKGLIDLLSKYENELTPLSLTTFYSYLRNLCAWISNTYTDNEEIRRVLLDLYKENLTKGYLHYEGRMAPSTYIAVSLIALRLKDFDWMQYFIEEYKDVIIGDNKTRDFYRFNKALYLFGIGKFDECLDNIAPNFVALDYLLHAKRLELKALYELDSNLFSFRLDSFKMYLSRTSRKIIPEVKRKFNSEFVNLLVQITNSIPGDPKRADQLVNRIKSRTQMAEWHWLLEKAHALKKRSSTTP